MKEEKPWSTKKVWTENSEAWKIKKENLNKELKVKQKEDNNTKLCSEKSVKKENKKEDKPWSVNNKPWENSRHLPGKDKSSKDSFKIINNKSSKTKTTSEEWSMKSPKRKENSLESSKNLPERVTSMRKNCSSWNKKSTKKEENHWLINKKSKKWNKLSKPAANKPNKKLECSQNNLKSKEEKAWLMKKEPKIFKEPSTKKFTSWTNLQEENPKTKDNCNSSESKFKDKEIKA